MQSVYSTAPADWANDFRRNRSSTSQIITTVQFIEGVRAKYLEAILLIVNCCRSFARIYICTVSICNLPRLRTSNVDKCDQRKWFYTKDIKKQKIYCRNYNRSILRGWFGASCKYIYPSQIQAGEGSRMHWPPQERKQNRVHVFLSRRSHLDNSSEISKQLHVSRYVNMRLAKASTLTYWLLIIWRSDLFDRMKRYFFQAAVVSILLNGFTVWTLTICIKKI